MYGVVKHMTDEPYSYDEFSYGRIPSQDRTTTTTSTTTMTPVIPHEEEEDDKWKIFPRNTQVGLKSSKNNFNFSTLLPLLWVLMQLHYLTFFVRMAITKGEKRRRKSKYHSRAKKLLLKIS